MRRLNRSMVAAVNAIASIRKRRPTPAELGEIDATLKSLGISLGELFEKRHAAPALEHMRQWTSSDLSAEMLDYMRELLLVTKQHMALLAGYWPSAIQAPIRIYRVGIDAMSREMRAKISIASCYPQIECEEVAGDHYGMLQEPAVEGLARRITEALECLAVAEDAV